jgi:glycosyltransferase involved in cell wall biosynthesis
VENTDRILFVIYSLNWGGAERHTIELASGLTTRGYRTQIAILDNSKQSLGSRTDVQVFNIAGSGIFDLNALKRLAALIKKLDPTHVVGVNERGLYYATVGSFLARKSAELVSIYHTTIPLGIRKLTAAKYFYRLFYRLAHKTVYVSEIQRKFWIDRGFPHRSSSVILNGIDVSHFSIDASNSMRDGMRKFLSLDPGQYTLGILAGLRPEKNHKQLLQSIAFLRHAGHVTPVLLIIGDGPLKTELVNMSVELGIENMVRFVGAHIDVRPFIAACDAGIICSTAVETFSLAALEMMAMGKPMIMSNIGGAAEMVVDNTNGLLFPSGDIVAMSQAIKKLGNPELRASFGHEAHAMVVEQFSRDGMLDRYSQLFERAPLGVCYA